VYFWFSVLCRQRKCFGKLKRCLECCWCCCFLILKNESCACCIVEGRIWVHPMASSQHFSRIVVGYMLKDGDSVNKTYFFRYSVAARSPQQHGWTFARWWFIYGPRIADCAVVKRWLSFRNAADPRAPCTLFGVYQLTRGPFACRTVWHKMSFSVEMTDGCKVMYEGEATEDSIAKVGCLVPCYCCGGA
jgi:hypothetical protein